MRLQAILALGLALALPAASAVSRDAPASAPAMFDTLFNPTLAETRAAILIVDGRVVARRYAPGYSDANRFISWSMAKTVTAMLIGELVADGRLKLDAPAPIAEWRRPGDPRGAITLRHLLNMASGLRHVEVGEPIEASDTNQVLFVGGTQDMAARAIAAPLADPPGTRFRYSSLTSIILAEIITRTLTDSRDPRVRAKAYRDFAEQRLFAPAAMRRVFLEFDGAGTQVGGSILHMPLDDWARFGRLLLDGRGADGRQVIAPEWLAFMKSPSPADPIYGGQTWRNVSGGEETLFPGKGPPGTVSAIGHLGQYVVAASAPVAPGGPARTMILVRLGKTQDDQLPPVRARLGDITAAVFAHQGALP